MADYLYKVMDNVLTDYSNDTYRLHNHNEYEIYMYLEGDCRYIIEEKNYELSHGDIIIIRKHEMHRVFHNSVNKNYHRIIIMVAPEFFQKMQCTEYENVFLNNLCNVGNKIPGNLVHSSGLYDAIMRMRKYTDAFTDMSSPISASTMIEILYLINKITMFEKPVTHNTTIENVINYINSHFTEDVSLDVISDRFFVSKYYLCHIFKEVTGLTVGQYINQRRLTLVEELKKEGKALNEAALLAGFCDYSSFYRAYRKRYHCSPTSSAGLSFFSEQ